MSLGANRVGLKALFAISLFTVPSSVLAEAVVQSSSGAAAIDYPRGKKLSAKPIHLLDEGDKVRVKCKNNKRIFIGPGKYPISRAVQKRTQTSMLQNIMKFFSGRTTEAAGVASSAAARGIEYPTPREIGDLDILRSETICLIPGRQLWLWRENSQEDLQIKITRTEGQKEAHVKFGKSENQVKWPEELYPDPVGEYQILVGESDEASMISIVPLELSERTQVGLATGLFTQQCHSQLEVYTYLSSRRLLTAPTPVEKM